MNSTATSELRALLASDFDRVEANRQFFERERPKLTQLNGKEKKELQTKLEKAQKHVCAKAFDRNVSPSLRLEKLVHIGDNCKKHEIDAVVDCQEKHSGNATPLIPRAAKTFVAKLADRLIVNQAGSIMENAGLCLHRHFGYPYIPGSAIKGCARHAAWCRWAEEADDCRKQDIARRIALTFGYPTGDGMPKKKGQSNRESLEYLDQYLAVTRPTEFGEEGKLRTFAGSVAFLQAVPHGKAKLVTDIVNCHHMQYYNDDKTRATDDESPNPQFFPAVEKGTSFIFSIVPVSRRTKTVKREYGFDPVEFAIISLKEAIEIHGIGAKTAAGYGWFRDDPEGQEYLQEKIQDAERAKIDSKQARQREQMLAEMSPEDRRVEELGEVDRDKFIGDYINHLKDKDQSEQRVILRSLLEKHLDIWLRDKNAKPKKKAGKRAVIVREVAEKLGVKLP